MKFTQTFIATRKSFLNSLKCLGRKGEREREREREKIVRGKGILHFKILEKGIRNEMFKSFLN
jgi:hypothetical protein